MLIDETLTALVRPPRAETGHERYAGDFVAVRSTAGERSPIGRILFYTDARSFDLIRAGSDVAWGSEASKIQTTQRILTHAKGDQPVDAAIAQRFVADHRELFAAGKPWSIPLKDVLLWLEEHP
jgi:hypothetical protein